MDRLNIGNVKFRSYEEIAFEDIRAQKDGGLVFEAQEISLRFFSNSTKNILKVVIKSASLDIKQPDKNAVDFIRKDFPDAPKKTLFPELECLGFDFKAQFKDLKFASRFSINVNLSQQKINTLHLDISSLDYQALHLENLLLLVKRDDVGGHLTIAKIKYDKVIIDEIQSSAHFENQNLLFDDLSAKVFNGNIIGSLVVSFVVLPGYQARLQFKGLNLKRFVEDLELENKFTMTGSVTGNISLEGQGALLKVLGGDFATDASGGRLIIKDENFLKSITQATSLAEVGENIYRVTSDAAVESLRDYNYNTGAVKLSLQDGDLLADIHLDGKQGKRNFNIVLHH